MKRIITILILFSALIVNAQPESKKNFRFGFTTGLNYAHFNGSDSKPFYSRAAYQLGIYTQHEITPQLFVQPQVMISAKGASEDVTINQDDLIFTYQLSYIEIPILLKYYFTKNPKLPVHPMIFAGPALSFQLNAELEGDLNGNTASEELENFKSSDVGIVFGAGLGIPIGTDEVSIIFKYTLGLVEIDQSNVNRKDYRNGVFTIGFGYTL